MKKIIYTVLSLLICGMVSCDSFLDQQPIDKQTTAEDIFTKKSSTEQYLNGCYRFLPEYWTISANEGWGPLSDEADVSFNHDVHKVHQGAFGPSAAYYKKWGSCYKGIRETTYFLNNVHMCRELSDAEMKRFVAEARFCRAYYYFLLIRNYGPVVLMGDRTLGPEDDGNIGRNPLDECVNYVCSELFKAAQDLEVKYENTAALYLGRPTKAAALALRARMMLYAASELFNPSGKSIYSDWKSNTTGENLMPTSYSKQKWVDAAEAARLVIDLPGYSLVEVRGDDGEIDPYQSLYRIYTTQWNDEIIYGRIFNDVAWYKRITPRAMKNCWGGYNPSQKQIDAFAMNTGVYPIRGYKNAGPNGNSDEPIVEAEAGYTETGYTTGYEHPFDKVKADTYNMYVNREPRFYLNITWNGMKLPYEVTGSTVTSTKNVQFYYGGNSGGPSGDRSITGYSVRKMYNNGNNSDQDVWIKPMLWPMIRLAEVYLNYTEALIEAGDLTNPDLLTYWNKVRARAGVPNIEEVYPGIESNQTLLREMIRRERQVELAFENHRYFDTRRWMIAEETNNDYVYGMNIMETTDKPIGGSAFWRRTPFKDYGKRVFPKAFYLHPIEQWELDRNTKLEQAPFY